MTCLGVILNKMAIDTVLNRIQPMMMVLHSLILLAEVLKDNSQMKL